MCLSCGCGKPDDDHGDPRNITMSDVNQAAQAAGTTRDRVLQNIMKGAQMSSTASEQSSQSSSGQQPDYNQAQAQQVHAGVQSSQGNNNQTDNQENNYGQVYNQPGAPGTTQGQESGTAWRQDTEDVNYVPPREPKQEPKR